MKKALILVLCVFLLVACSKQHVAEPEPVVQPEHVVEAAPEPVVQEEPVIPADTFALVGSDPSEPITLKYKIDPNNKAVIQSVKFEIRNWGESSIKPVVLLLVGGESEAGLQRFEYDEIPAGYKMIKNEVINTEVSAIDEPNLIKADLRNGLKDDAFISEHQLTYIAQPTSN